METKKRSTSTELNKEVSAIQKPVPEEQQMIADPAPVPMPEPGPVPQPPLKEISKEEAAKNLQKQAGYDPKANRPTDREKQDFEDAQKQAKSAK